MFSGRALEQAVSEDCPDGVTWNVCRVQAPKVWPQSRGSDIGIGIIDTGIARHPDLHIAGGINTVGGSSYHDDNGHGTHVAGIAAALGTNGRIPGVAPRAKLYAVKALNANGEGFVSGIIKGIDWCIQKRIPVINMSVGISGGSSRALREAIQRARDNGIVVVASAGNNGDSGSGIDEPASFPETIAVAASTQGNGVASFSSRGNGIDVTAPGADIKSTWVGGGYKRMSGTSMASPHVAGGAALLLAKQPGMRPSEVSRRLKSSARRLSGFSSRSQGSGLIQLAGAIQAGGSATGGERSQGSMDRLYRYRGSAFRSSPKRRAKVHSTAARRSGAACSPSSDRSSCKRCSCRRCCGGRSRKPHKRRTK
jgi:minor extracellular protease Epr